MRLSVAILLALASSAHGVAAQEGPTGTVALPVHGPRPSVPVSSEAEVPSKPADVVARLAREAMASPTDAAAWQALAGALPDFALSGGADLEGTFEAARVADSLGASAAPMVGESTREADLPALPSVWKSLPPMRLDLLLAAIATLVGGVVVWRTALSRGQRRRTRAPAPQGRLWTARALASGGIDVSEIARRVGMTQEAVTLALRMSGARPAPVAPAQATVSTRRSTREQDRNASIRQEMLASVERLRDRRLTYGGGAL